MPERPFREIESAHGSDPSRRTFWPGCSACTPAVTTISPVSRPSGDGDRRLVEAQHVDVAHRHGQARRIDDPDRGLLVELRQRGRRDLDEWTGVQLHAAGDGRAEPHRLRRIGQADLDLEGPGHGIGLRRHLAHAPARRHGRVVASG